MKNYSNYSSDELTRYIDRQISESKEFLEGWNTGYHDKFPECPYEEKSYEYNEWWNGYNEGSYEGSYEG